LIFTPGEITSSAIYIDDEYLGKANNVEGPVYTITWNPDLYKEGVHCIKLVVEVSQMY